MAKKAPGALGIDLGGTKTLIVLFDGRFRPVARVKFKTEPERGKRHFIQNLERGLERLQRRAQRAKLTLAGVGLGSAGRIDEEAGKVLASPNIPFLEGMNVGALLEKRTGLKARVRNDVQAGLYGEHKLGAARGRKNVLGVFIGTGIGGAVIIDGRLHRGESGVAGELGRFIISYAGPLSGSERSGILDNIASRTAVAAEAAALAAKQWAPHLFSEVGTDLSNIRSKALARAIRHGDEQVEQLVRSRSRMVGIAVANLVNFLAPDMVVFGGGMVEAMARLVVREAEQAMRDYVDPAICAHLKVREAALGDDCIAAGAARMVWEEAMGRGRD